jgi:hypothetical protein
MAHRLVLFPPPGDAEQADGEKSDDRKQIGHDT